MSEFVIYSIERSPLGRAVLVALIEKSASYRLSLINPRDTNSPETLLRHPLGRVPVLEHGNFHLYETQAILRYIDRVMPQPALTPPEPRAAARMDQLMNLNDWHLSRLQRVVGAAQAGVVSGEPGAAFLPEARHVVDVIAAHLAGKPYFAGPKLSLADILLAPQFDQFAGRPEWAALSEGHANLAEWLTRMNERPSMRQTVWR